MTKRTALAIRLVGIVVIAACLYFFVHKIDWDQLGHELATTIWWPIVVAAALNFVCLLGKATSWRVMLAPRYQVPLLRLYRYTIAAFAASAIAPARAGEVLRIWALKRRDGVPVAETAAVALGEKLLDALTMLVLVAPVPWLLPNLPPWIGNGMLLASVVAVLLFAVLYVLHGRIKLGERKSWFARFIDGMHVLHSPKRLALSFAALAVTWLADLTMVMLTLYAIGIDVPVAAGLLILATLNLVILVPSTPAQVGALQVGVLAATRILGIPDEPALAFALIYHALQIVPLVIVGFALEYRLVIGRVPERELERPA